jgi:hypothetical protein
MEFSFSPEEMERLSSIRRTARKLASHQSRTRVIRKLPQTVTVIRVKKPEENPVHRVRHSLNLHKRLAYIVLLGLVVGAYFHDADENRIISDAQKVKGALSVMEETVQEARLFYLGV